MHSTGTWSRQSAYKPRSIGVPRRPELAVVWLRLDSSPRESTGDPLGGCRRWSGQHRDASRPNGLPIPPGTTHRSQARGHRWLGLSRWTHLYRPPSQAPWVGIHCCESSSLPRPRGNPLDFDRVGSEQIKSVPPTVQYEAEAVALRLLSPLSQERDTLIELSAAQIYHRALNDLIVVLELNAADRVTMPGLDPSQFQPWGLLTTLLAGGTYLHIDAKTLRETPNAWTDYRPTVLGLNDSTRKQFKEHFASISDSLRLWFRDISEPLDWQAWDDFQTGFETQRPWGINLLVNAAFGGTLFFSPRADRVPPIDVTPAPGLPWTLLDQSGPGETRRRSTGLYAAPDSDITEDHHGRLLLSQPKPAELYFIGTIDGVSGARTYPIKEVKEVVCTLPSISECLVLELDRLMDVSDVPVNLLVSQPRSSTSLHP